MPYIGKSPVAGGFHKLDNLTASATDTYALTLGSAAYYPESANQLLVSLNGVIQAPQDSFTVSGSNIVFDSALTASDSIDFIVALGDVIGVGSVTDGAITTAKLGNGAVTDAKIDTMAASKLTGALPAIDGSALTGISAYTVGSVVSLNGSSDYTWTNIPSGINAFRLVLNDVSASTTANLAIRVGTSSGIETGTVYNHGSGYYNGAGQDGYSYASDTGFLLTSWSSDANHFWGHIDFTNINGNKWHMKSSISVQEYYDYHIFWNGDVTLSGTLDRLQLYFSAGSFDDGYANIIVL